MTAGEKVQVISHSTPVAIGLMITIVGVVYASGMMTAKVLSNERQVQQNAQAIASITLSLERLTAISQQQQELLKELRDELHK